MREKNSMKKSIGMYCKHFIYVCRRMSVEWLDGVDGLEKERRTTVTS